MAARELGFPRSPADAGWCLLVLLAVTAGPAGVPEAGSGCDSRADEMNASDTRVEGFNSAAAADRPPAPRVGEARVLLGGEPCEAPCGGSSDFLFFARSAGPQLAIRGLSGDFTAAAGAGEEVRVSIPLEGLPPRARILVEVCAVLEAGAEVEVTLAGRRTACNVEPGSTRELALEVPEGGEGTLVFITRGQAGEAGVRWSRLRWVADASTGPIRLAVPSAAETLPPPVLPAYRQAIEQELIEWDWRMQDGIGTPREPRTWQQAAGRVLEQGDRLIGRLASQGVRIDELATEWAALRAQIQDRGASGAAAGPAWEELWRSVHRLRRRLALADPLARCGPLLFVKQVPSSFSHQLTQYAGRCARPGGGLFVLDAPGVSLSCRRLGSLPEGCVSHPDVRWDGRRVLFAFCATDPDALDWREDAKQFYQLYEMEADGSGLRQLTSGPWDDFAPRYLPDGQLLFLSTRRGGFHRCGRGPCPVHTLATADADGSQPRVISFHETHEWDPAVLHDGRILYTRWDYVDRHAVHYQQLWTVRPDGSDVRAFYGNHTLNPVGVWEGRPIPGSHRVMATAAAHHAMTAGSIILLDTARGRDGLEPITRLTPDVLFPESESPVGPWHAPAGVTEPPQVPPEERRWPGHCYRSPYPLSDDVFLAAYSFEPLVGEPQANRANLFGLYLVDRDGNKELLYRDLAIGSLWPMPLAPRPRPPALPRLAEQSGAEEGTFLLQDVYASWPQLDVARGEIARLRILQVLPKTTPNANAPRVGLANASPGKQVLGTVPVESDGSAHFRAPAGIPLAFQALDRQGMAVQTMRSLTCLQPGETVGCVGCHEHRGTTPAAAPFPLAARREPSCIAPGPDGSNPFSYPRLVQPVLDRTCIRCHSRGGGEQTAPTPGLAERGSEEQDGTGAHGDLEPAGGIDLTSEPAGEFTASYLALAPRVPYSEWKGTPQANDEPLAGPGRFGARASQLMVLLRKGHEGVALDAEDFERLATWMDANALFYGTFDPADQQRQRRGERIAGPALE